MATGLRGAGFRRRSHFGEGGSAEAGIAAGGFVHQAPTFSKGKDHTILFMPINR